MSKSDSSGNAGSLFFGMTLNTNDFKKKLKDASKTLKTTGGRIKKNLKTIAKGGSLLSGAIAGSSAILLSFAKVTAEATNAQILFAKSIGSTQSEVSGLELASEKLGVETSQVLDKVREFGGLDEFKIYADQVKNAGGEQEQLNKAIEIFGGEGAKLVNILKLGSSGLKEMEQEALKLGLGLSPEQIAKTTKSWNIFEDTLLSIKGLSKQLGTTLMQPFALASGAVDAFIKTFRKDMLNTFNFISDIMSSSIRAGINVFHDVGIPAITTYISFVNQIGSAFARLFNFIANSSPLKSIVGGIKEVASTLNILVANFEQIFISGVTGSISTVIQFAFNSLSKFSDFIGDQLVTLAFAIGKDDFAQNLSDAFTEQSIKIEKIGKDLAQPFVIAMKDADKKLEENIEKQADQTLKNQLVFKGVVLNIEKALSTGSEKLEKNIKRGFTESIKSISSQRSGLAITGSQEEFRTRSQKQDQMLEIHRKNLMANQKIAKNTLKTGVF